MNLYEMLDVLSKDLVPSPDVSCQEMVRLERGFIAVTLRESLLQLETGLHPR